MRYLLCLALVSTLAFAGCDLQSDNAGTSPRLVGRSLTSLSPAAQAVVDQGGELVWEVQDVIGRSYAVAEQLPSVVPGDADLLIVIADASTCTPKCDVLEIAPFHTPQQASVSALDVEGAFGAQLLFER